jgi:HKD family nuclease
LNGLFACRSDIRMAVAFASSTGLKLLADGLNGVLKSGGSLEFLIGLDMRGTDPRALREILSWTKKHAECALYWLGSLEPASIYHPKVYLLRSNDDASCIVGSSNLTKGGLQANVEANIELTGNLADEAIADLYATYSQLKFHPNRVIPDDELIDLYEEATVRQKKADAKSRRSVAESEERFSKKVASLRRPQPTAKDLVGWVKAVFDLLPVGEFTNEDLYKQEAALTQMYPGNLNIRAKIRQQLQVLRDLGLLAHVAPGRWRRA